MGLTILGTPPQILRYQETYETVRQVVDENGGEMQYTDVAEFLVRQMADKFHTTDLLLMQVDLSFLCLTSLSQAAMAAANGNVHEKAWKKAVSYLELAIPGVRWSHFPFNKM